MPSARSLISAHSARTSRSMPRPALCHDAFGASLLPAPRGLLGRVPREPCRACLDASHGHGGRVSEPLFDLLSK